MQNYACLQHISLDMPLHTAARGHLLVPCTRQLGKQAFSVAARTAWNSLSEDI